MNICISRPWSGTSHRLSRSDGTRPALLCVAIGLLVAVSPVVLKGQGSGPTRESWTVGVAGGVFDYELAPGQDAPIFVVRADVPTSKWVRLEVGTSYARPEVQTNAEGAFDPSLPAEHTKLFTVTVAFISD